MTPPRSALERSGGKPVILAWEPPRGATPDDQLAAIAVLAAQLGSSAAGILISWDPDVAREANRFAEALARSKIRALPLLRLLHPEATDDWKRVRLPASLSVLAQAGVLCEFDGVRLAVAAVEGRPHELEVLAALLPALRQVLSTPEHSARIGWLRHTSAHLPTPQMLDFALDWPPYGAFGGLAPGERRSCAYPMVVSDLARRHAGDSPVAPSVIWSATTEAEVHNSAVLVTEISPLKSRYAIDTARRFVHNRIGQGMPFWVLRAAFSPADPRHLPAFGELAQTLAQPRRPSATLGQVASLVTRCERNARIAVVIHLYYPELWPDFAEAIEAIPETFNLYVSCPFRVLAATQCMVQKQYPLARVFAVQNLGRDVLPFLLWLRAVGADAYTYVLKLHGKKSAHIIDPAKSPTGGGDVWRRNTIGALLGDRQHAQALVRALDAAPEVGVVAPAGYLYDQIKWRSATGDLMETALMRLGIECRIQGSFAAGTMFWARMTALTPFALLPDELLDFEREAGQVDGTLHHAYERLFALVAEATGYRVTDSALLLE